MHWHVIYLNFCMNEIFRKVLTLNTLKRHLNINLCVDLRKSEKNVFWLFFIYQLSFKLNIDHLYIRCVI